MRTLSLTVVAIVAFLLMSCTNRTAYDTYQHTPTAGWEKNDTISFDVPAMAAAGEYTAELGLRIDNSFPFMGVTLIVEQESFPGRRVWTDTLTCELIDKKGYAKGQGLSYYQYAFPITPPKPEKGDSLHVAVRHDMKREILPGVSDIGFKLSLR